MLLKIIICRCAGCGASQVWAVLDPLSKVAQRLAPILDFLRRTLALTMKVRSLHALQFNPCNTLLF